MIVQLTYHLLISSALEGENNVEGHRQLEYGQHIYLQLDDVGLNHSMMMLFIGPNKVFTNH